MGVLRRRQNFRDCSERFSQKKAEVIERGGAVIHRGAHFESTRMVSGLLETGPGEERDKRRFAVSRVPQRSMKMT